MAKYRVGWLLLLVMACGLSGVTPKLAQGAGSNGESCLGCHDFGPDSPVHPMLFGAHGNNGHDGTPMNQAGCESCHGASVPHTKSPTQAQPTVSFGPRWTAAAAAQDETCLACHEDNVAKHWRDALHMESGVTCVSCHDAHVAEDKIVSAAGQLEVCTVCHKDQKDGIHGIHEQLADNPACTSCHNPHDDRSALSSMLDNRSQGCRNCHDLVDMSASAQVTEKAKSYHKVMVKQDRTCLDCHQSVAHASAKDVPPLIPVPARSRQVTLFYPGQSDSDWLISEHPGAQPLRQGTNCQQCHRGDEVSLGESLAGDFAPASRQVDVGFKIDKEALVLALSWDGSADDVGISIMWGDDGDQTVRRGSCFAACHSDMPDMTRDQGQQVEKYLWASRSQQRSVGNPAITRSADELAELVREGVFAELWRVTLGAQPAASTATLLAGIDWHSDGRLQVTANFDDGRWQVELRRALVGQAGAKTFTSDGKYSLGIALHGPDNPGAKHWVSLPMTLSLSGDETDFKAR
ncbi:MAG: cytochrome c3 family protein [Halioglobus sp.]